MNQDSTTVDHQASMFVSTNLPARIGQFEIRGLLGRGMSQVLLGWDSELNREVAIKILRQAVTTVQSTRTEEPRTGSLILDEARKLAQLNVPGVVTVYECKTGWVEIAGQTLELDYMVCEKIHGMTLRQWQKENCPDDQRIARIFCQIAETLQQVHAQGIYHRDIKPENVMVDGTGNPILIDFGLALLSGVSLSNSPVGLSGTIPYMSPEQTRGEINVMDGRSDLYSLGVTLYEMLTGRLPFQATASGQAGVRELITAIGSRQPQPLRQLRSDVPLRLEELCLKLLAKQPGDRYATAADIAFDLHVYLGDISTEVYQPLAVFLTNDSVWLETDLGQIDRGLRQLRPSYSFQKPVVIGEVARDALLRADLLRSVVARTIGQLRTFKRDSVQVHLIPRTSIMAGFAIGYFTDHQHTCHLYHLQNGQLYEIWKMARDTKNARSPVAGKSAEFSFFSESLLPSVVDISIGEIECLVIHVGANPILEEVVRWRDKHLPNARIRSLTKKPDELSPTETQSWVQAAAEIAMTLKASPARDIYLFFDGPATLALMAGDAIGAWARKKIHLMQFDRDPNAVDAYQELIVLPDEELEQRIIGAL